MRRGGIFSLALATLVAALAVTASGPAGASTVARCGSLRAHYHERGTRQYVQATSIRARGLRCGYARHVTRKWGQHSRLSGDPADHAIGFRCHYERLGSDIGTTTCRGKKHRRVRFDAYDSSPFH
jgi:hypothetical protein